MLEAAVKPKPAPMTDDSTAEAGTFAELTSGKFTAKSGTLLFKLSSLHDLYVSRQSS